jgi:hypothetical protein
MKTNIVIPPSNIFSFLTSQLTTNFVCNAITPAKTGATANPGPAKVNCLHQEIGEVRFTHNNTVQMYGKDWSGIKITLPQRCNKRSVWYEFIIQYRSLYLRLCAGSRCDRDGVRILYQSTSAQSMSFLDYPSRSYLEPWKKRSSDLSNIEDF